MDPSQTHFLSNCPEIRPGIRKPNDILNINEARLKWLKENLKRGKKNLYNIVYYNKTTACKKNNGKI